MINSGEYFTVSFHFFEFVFPLSDSDFSLTHLLYFFSLFLPQCLSYRCSSFLILLISNSFPFLLSVSIIHLASRPSTTLLFFSSLRLFLSHSFFPKFLAVFRLIPTSFCFCLSLSSASSVSSNVPWFLPRRLHLLFLSHFLFSFFFFLFAPLPRRLFLILSSIFFPSHHVRPLFRLLPPVSCLLKHQRSQRAVEPPADSTHNSPLFS